jgi:hypothetical protein
MLTPQINVTLGRKALARTSDTSVVSSEIDWDVVGQKAAIAQETAETVGKIVLKMYVGKRLLDTVCQIAVIAAKAKLK